MNTNILQQRIEEKAKERFDKDFADFANFVKNNPIASKLRIDNFSFMNTSGSVTDTFFNGTRITEYGESKTNIKKIESSLIERYIKEETDKLLSKIDILSDYINS